MNLQTTARKLGIEDAADVFREDWDAIQQTLPAGGPPFLQPEQIARDCETVLLPADMAQAVAAAAQRVAANDALSALAWYCHCRLFGERPVRPEFKSWPLPTHALDRDAGLFYVLVLLSGIPSMQRIHREREIPADVIRDTVADLKRCLETEDYFLRTGHWGISQNIFGWLMHSWRGDLYHLGRLQFKHGPFTGRLRAFRHRRARAVLALAEDGVAFRADGQMDVAGQEGAPDGWTSTLEISDTAIAGFPIDPRGFAVHRRLRLPASEWEPALLPNDRILEIHIPAGPPPMDYDACGESLRRALAFFPKYFPDRPFKAFVCSSWILDPQFEALLKPESNLVRFQKEVYLYPLRGGGTTMIWQVFGLRVKDIRSAPRKTSMQRALAEHVEKGGRFRSGGCFLFPADFNWGAQVYRTDAVRQACAGEGGAV
ncbi:MAG: DUF5596 domain-containing protein [Kiritimatiellae bacterium]|nr:DUF5596 domain-containing protein [Kiritimatiellia bacterium]